MTLGQHLLLPSQVARELGISSRTVVRLVDAGKLEGVKTPLGRMIDPTSVQAERERRRAARTKKLRAAA